MPNGMNLVYDFSGLDECIKNMTDVKSNVEKTNDEIGRLRDKVSEDWRGKGKTAYDERCTALTEKLKKLRSEMNTNIEKLSYAVSTYRTSEQEQVTKVKLLSKEDIF